MNEPAAEGRPAPDGSLFHPRWHRVAALRPQLRSHVECRLQMQRGEPFYVLRDLGSDNAHRLNRAAYAFVGRCDGQATVQQIWDAVIATRPDDDVMTQAEAIDLLVGLHNRGLLQFDVTPDVEALFHVRDKRQRQRRRGAVNPMAFRLPLGNPANLLAPLARWWRPLLSGPGCVLWLVLVLGGTVAAAMHWAPLRAEAGRLLQAPGYVLLAWLCYPFIKTLHEAAHALVLQRFGAQVRQAGVTLILLSPVPFVDASAADGLRRRGQRALVSAAGIMAELALAALAVFVWVAVQPGLLRDIAFVVAFTGALSTLLVNGNPLLRYDGYFVLCDLLDLRNLASRSGRYWAEGFGRYLFGVRPAAPVEPLPGERLWLTLYAPLSWVYRLVLSVVIALWLGGFSALLGLVVAVLLLGANIVLPLWRTLSMLRLGLLEERRSGLARLRIAAVAVAVVGVLGWLPVPFNTVAQGVVWLPEQAQVRAGTDGFVTTLHAENGQRVQAGTLIAQLSDPPLQARRATLTSQIAELDVRLFHAIDKAPHEAPDLRAKLAYQRAEAARLDERVAQLALRAHADGVLVLPPRQELLGQFRRRGESVGYLLTDAPSMVRVALPQQQADLVAGRLHGVQVRLAGDPDVHAGRIGQQVPGTVARLPSAALGAAAGGPIALDPSDPDGLKTLAPVVLLDVEVPEAGGERFGGRAHVRFSHGQAPIASQALRHLQQLMLGHFDPAG